MDGGHRVSGQKQNLPDYHQSNNMDRIKPVKEVFCRFSADKSSFSIVQVNGQKGETGPPFIIEPAASQDRLSRFIVSHIIHDQQKNISL